MTIPDLLRSLWRGHKLTVWWETWEGEYPQWQASLESPNARSAVKITDSALLESVKPYVKRTKQYRGDRLEWRLSDAGLARLGLPTAEEMGKVTRA